MAATGKIPFISSYAMFSPGRNWEQIRTTICYNNTNVKIAGSHAGVSVGPDGGTHQALEDLALMRVLPRMTVISPCDAIEAKKATVAAAKLVGPTYIRLAREKTPIITTNETSFEIGKSQVFYQSNAKADVGIIATGSLVHKALLAAKELEADGFAIKLLNLSTIKPLDQEALISLAKETGAIVTVEEHQIAGGMGSAVSEFLAAVHPVRLAFVGVNDRFGQSGKPEELIEHYGMGVDSIVKAVRKIRDKE
jgi:transketolase